MVVLKRLCTLVGQKTGQKFLALRSELEDLGMIMPRLKDLAQSKFHIHRLHSDSQIHIVSHQVPTRERPPVEMVPRTMLRDTNRCLEGSE